jgi:hypothetical protein
MSAPGQGDFTEADAVSYVPLPTDDGTDQNEWATRTTTNVKNALSKAASVKRILVLSAQGLQYGHSIV